jgi:hypothetical protein
MEVTTKRHWKHLFLLRNIHTEKCRLFCLLPLLLALIAVLPLISKLVTGSTSFIGVLRVAKLQASWVSLVTCVTGCVETHFLLQLMQHYILFVLSCKAGDQPSHKIMAFNASFHSLFIYNYIFHAESKGFCSWHNG